MSTTEPRPTRRRSANAGISLIETVVALGLFAISAGAIGNYLVQQIRMAGSNHLHTQAYAIAEEELESVRALRWAEMAPASRTETVGGTEFTVERTVGNNSPANGLKTITVDVSWKEPQGARHVVVQTIYTEVQRY